MSITKSTSWTDSDEKHFLDYLASGKWKGNIINKTKPMQTLAERKRNLRSWIISCTKRRWDSNINLKHCEGYAQSLLRSL